VFLSFNFSLHFIDLLRFTVYFISCTYFFPWGRSMWLLKWTDEKFRTMRVNKRYGWGATACTEHTHLSSIRAVNPNLLLNTYNLTCTTWLTFFLSGLRLKDVRRLIFSSFTSFFWKLILHFCLLIDDNSCFCFPVQTNCKW